MSSPSIADAARALKPRAFALELTKGCNLRCGYCYYAGREQAYDPKTRMSREVAYQSVEMLLRDGPEEQPVHVHFFGGEPLLDFALLADVTLYGERRAREAEKTITFELTTNGTRLEPDVIAFLNEHRVAVGVSFDGPPEVQDANRPLAGGSSYALAAPKVRALLASRVGSGLKTHASVVVTRLELDLVKLVRHLEELGFEKILLTPATDLEGKSNGLSEADLPRAFAAIDALAAEYERRIRAGERVSETWFPRLVGRIQSGQRMTQFCSGGRDYLGVAADGKVALCYRFFEDERFAMGSVQTGIERGVSERILAAPVDERTVCSRCWARHYCGGGCHHDNQSSQGAIETPNPVSCELFRHGMERALDAWGRLTRGGMLPGRRSGALSSHGMEPIPPADARPKLVPGTHARELGPERIVYDPATHEVVVLNESAAYILELCDGTRSSAQLLEALERRYAAPRERLQADLEATLRELYAKKLVVGMTLALELELLGVPVRLESDEAELLANLGTCYALSLRAAPAAHALTARVTRMANGYRVAVDTRAARSEPDAIAAVRALNHELLQALMQRCRAHYFVHAAVVVHQGRALVLPGLSRSGKSTLALALVLAGARYLSDELLCYTSAARAEALPRALKIRDECVPYFPELAGRFVGQGEGRFVPFEALARDVLAPPAPIGAIAVPRWSAGAPDRPEPLARGEALLALAAASLNFGAHREHSLDWLTAIVGETAAFSIAWSDPRAAARALLAELGG